MKTIVQKTMWLWVIAVVLVSCAKDGNNGGLLGGAKLLVTESKIDDKMSARYEYDGENRLIKLYTHDDEGRHQTTITYQYSSNGLLTFVEMVNTEGEIEYRETYTYGDGDKPVSSTTVFAPEDAENAITTTYSYSANKVVETSDIPGGYTSEMIYTLDGNGNLLSIEISSQGEWVSTTEFGDYDDRHAAGRYGNPYAWKFNSPNNYRSEKATTSFAAGNHDRIIKYTRVHDKTCK